MEWTRPGTGLFLGILMIATPAWAELPRETLVPRVLEQATNLRPHVLRLALEAYDEADRAGVVRRDRLTIIDYELSSYEKRLWVVDVPSGEVLLEEWVAHGMGRPAGTGGDLRRVRAFSNREGTRMSSLGAFLTAETYHGKHGYSLRLDGLEPGFNDAARRRTIVIHGAAYVSGDRARSGSMGRSWGCPAVRTKASRRLIDAIRGGSLVWAYYPQSSWLEASRFLQRKPTFLASADHGTVAERPASARGAGAP